MESFKKLNFPFFLSTLCFVMLVGSCGKKNSPTGPENAPTTFTDIDGNVYPIVKIGNQLWMAENLKVTHYRNGDPIPDISDSTEWGKTATGALCHYANNEANSSIYGCLYNWYTIDDSRGIAPEGWHVPSDEEWKELELHLGISQSETDKNGWRGTDEGGKLKEAGTAHWEEPNTGATNQSGFTVLPAGYRSSGLLTYAGLARETEFWSTTENGNVWSRSLSAFRSNIARGPKTKKNGLSIRCIKDN